MYATCGKLRQGGRLGKGRGEGHSHGNSEQSLRFPPTLQMEEGNYCGNYSKLLWPEHWAVCIFHWTRPEGRGFNTQQERLKPDNRQNFLLELLNSKLVQHCGVPCPPGPSRAGATPGGFRRGPSCTMAGAWGRTLRTAPHRGGWGWERATQPFSYVCPGFLHTEVALSAPWKTFVRDERERRGAALLHQARLGTCPLPAGPSGCTHQAELSTSQTQAQTDKEGAGFPRK